MHVRMYSKNKCIVDNNAFYIINLFNMYDKKEDFILGNIIHKNNI